MLYNNFKALNSEQRTAINDAIKDYNKLTEAQKEAFNQTYTAVMNILSEEAKKYLTVAVGDLNLYITQKIEAEVNANKTTN